MSTSPTNQPSNPTQRTTSSWPVRHSLQGRGYPKHGRHYCNRQLAAPTAPRLLPKCDLQRPRTTRSCRPIRREGMSTSNLCTCQYTNDNLLDEAAALTWDSIGRYLLRVAEAHDGNQHGNDDGSDFYTRSRPSRLNAASPRRTRCLSSPRCPLDEAGAQSSARGHRRGVGQRKTQAP
jgi:hypothetical protein